MTSVPITRPHHFHGGGGHRGWPQDHLDALADLCVAGLKATEAAAELNRRFGTCYTKDAVVGVAIRRGFHWKRSKGPYKQRRDDRRERAHELRAAGHRPGPKLVPQQPRSLLDPGKIPVAQRRQLFELRDTQCRFPYGDPGTPSFFCCGGDGADMSIGIPYCRMHLAIAYNPRR